MSIHVENLSKFFYPKKRNTLRDVFKDFFSSSKKNTPFLALDNISFSLNPGDTVALLGGNGAGKSTLLKTISRVYHPSQGSITVKGRLASLLEVGSGFHPDLNGRENIYLNGAMLGIPKSILKAREEEIIDFAGIAPFISTPIRYYSSGMELKLAFSIACHADPDIFIIDEALSVGDEKFQKKALEKMRSLARSGKTLLFVSHHLPTLFELCQKGLFLEKGGLSFFGPLGEAIVAYKKSLETKKNLFPLYKEDIHLHSFTKNSNDNSFYLQWESASPTLPLIHISTLSGVSLADIPLSPLSIEKKGGAYSAHIFLPSIFSPGSYTLYPAFKSENKVLSFEETSLPFFIDGEARHLPLSPGPERLVLSLDSDLKNASTPPQTFF